MEEYREAARAVRALGHKCIEKRIKNIQCGEEVPNDILSQILRTRSMTYSIKLITQQQLLCKKIIICV